MWQQWKIPQTETYGLFLEVGNQGPSVELRDSSITRDEGLEIEPGGVALGVEAFAERLGEQANPEPGLDEGTRVPFKQR